MNQPQPEEPTSDQLLLRGKATEDERIYTDVRALKSLDNGDPVGLESLDFGSVRGNPAVSYTSKTGERRVMRVSTPTWMASMKARTEFRQQAREHALAEARRQDIATKIGPKFGRAMESLVPQYGELFGSVMAEAFQTDPMGAAQAVIELQRLERGNAQQAAQSALAMTGNLLAGRSQRNQAAVNAAHKHALKEFEASIEAIGVDPIKAQERFSELNQSAQNTGIVQSALANSTGAHVQIPLSQRLSGNEAIKRRFYNAMFDELSRGAIISGGRVLKATPPGGPDDPGSLPDFLSSVQTYLSENGYPIDLTEADVAQILQQAYRYNGKSNTELDISAATALMDSYTTTSPSSLETQKTASDRFASDRVSRMQAEQKSTELEAARTATMNLFEKAASDPSLPGMQEFIDREDWMGGLSYLQDLAGENKAARDYSERITASHELVERLSADATSR